MEGSLSANWSFDWSKINIPTLVMTGHLDKMFRIPEDIEELEKKGNIDQMLIRFLTVRVKKHDLETNYFSKKDL